MKKKHYFWSYLLLGLIAATLIVLNILSPKLRYYFSPEFVQGFISSFGAFAFVAFVLFLVITIPVPVPNEPLILIGGYLFGFWFGSLAGWIGLVLSAVVCFYLARLSGGRIIEKFTDPHHIKHFNAILKKRGPLAILALYAMPLIPEDSLSFLLGFTKMRLRRFVGLIALGYIPRVLIVVSFGASLKTGLSTQTFVTLGILIVFILITIFREKIKRFLFKEVRAIEKKAVKMEHSLKI